MQVRELILKIFVPSRSPYSVLSNTCLTPEERFEALAKVLDALEQKYESDIDALDATLAAAINQLQTLFLDKT